MNGVRRNARSVGLLLTISATLLLARCDSDDAPPPTPAPAPTPQPAAEEEKPLMAASDSAEAAALIFVLNPDAKKLMIANPDRLSQLIESDSLKEIKWVPGARVATVTFALAGMTTPLNVEAVILLPDTFDYYTFNAVKGSIRMLLRARQLKTFNGGGITCTSDLTFAPAGQPLSTASFRNYRPFHEYLEGPGQAIRPEFADYTLRYYLWPSDTCTGTVTHLDKQLLWVVSVQPFPVY